MSALEYRIYGSINYKSRVARDMKYSELRAPLYSSGSHYDLDTGVCLVDAKQLFSQVIVNPTTEGTFVHETAHWLTEAMTSMGQLLVFLKCVRDHDILRALVSSPAVRRLILDRMTGPVSRPIIEQWDSYGYSPTPIGGREDAVFQNWVGNFRAEAVFCHGEQIDWDLGSRVATVAGAMEYYTDFLNASPYLNNRTFGSRESDRFMENSLRRGWLSESALPALQSCGTIQLFEALGVMAEYVWASKEGIRSEYGQMRFDVIRRTSYFAPIREILLALGVLATVDTVVAYSAMILTVLEVALNPPIPPIENCSFNEMSWQHVYPPLRFARIISLLPRLRPQRLSQEGGSDRDVAPRYMSEILYRAADPPGRDWHVRITENIDLNVFCELPSRSPMENMFAWISNGRWLLPYDLRMWCAAQLRLMLSQEGITTLSQAILAPSLKFTRYSDPLITLRGEDAPAGSSDIPAGSQLIQSSEVLEWYLVNCGVQYAGADILLGKEHIVYHPYGGYGDIGGTNWFPELEGRSAAMLESILKI